MSAVEIGPFVFSIERFAALLGVAVFIAVAEVLARATRQRSLSVWASSAAVWGLVGARLGHVALYWSGFAEDPLRIFAIWQGGFSAIGAAGAVALFTSRAFLKGLPLIPAAGALWAGVIAWQAVLLDLAERAPVPVPLIELGTVDGGSVPLQSLRPPNTPMVVNLWATWCPPCRRELPMLAAMAAEQTGVAFVFASQGETAQQVGDYLVQNDLTPTNVVIDGTGALARHYSTVGLPVTLFIGRDGLLSHTHFGEISPEVLLREIGRLQE